MSYIQNAYTIVKTEAVKEIKNPFAMAIYVYMRACEKPSYQEIEEHFEHMTSQDLDDALMTLYKMNLIELL